MIKRTFWENRINTAWQNVPLVWLCGVRRVGKTTLVKSFGEDKVQYLNCDLPIVADMLSDIELFYKSCNKPIIVFDEIHQLNDPARILKIAADQFRDLKIIATGSSTLSATKKIKDTLTGRKRVIHLLPVLYHELDSFDNTSIFKRLLHGGLPSAMLNEKKDPEFYREWMDSFYSRDIQKLFAFRESHKFNLLMEYIFRQSGSLWDVSSASKHLGISRQTISSHIEAMEITKAVTLLRPFHGGGKRELFKMPKVYAFDTGFISFFRGWDPLRPDDYGILWEHIVLESLQAFFYNEPIYFWRDTSGHEIDFIRVRTRDEVDVYECKWNPNNFNSKSLTIFRSFYPKGNNYIVSPVTEQYKKHIKNFIINITYPLF
ncbi:MAG: hypothetical protein ACD_79C01248G0001 [uncultured bacterium]|nr:MAG: hypothetical protein ACD_79C01248G0001 [uncultured bacterium]